MFKNIKNVQFCIYTMGKCVGFLDNNCGVWRWVEVFLSCYLGIDGYSYEVTGTDCLFVGVV